MGYYIDLEKISIEKYKEKLKSAYLPPSRMILKDNTDVIFNHFSNIGIRNAKELISLLKKKESFAELQNANCLSTHYLTILLRELKSTLPKPNKIKDFKDVSENMTLALEKIGIMNTLKLYEHVLSIKARKELALKIGVSEMEILKLTKLTDLSRIKWVGVTFARMLYDLGIDTVEKASEANPIELHKQINQLNKDQKIYKGQIGLNDIKIFVNAAKEVPVEIKY